MPPLLLPLLPSFLSLFLGADPAAALTESVKTERFEIRFRPGSRAEASVDRVAALAEKELTAILARLEFGPWRETIRVFLYDDVAELQKITGTQASGYAIPLELHLPHDNDQTRIHEMVHVVAERFKETGTETRNLFFAEGLANAVLEFVHGVHVDAVAAFEKKRGALPSLAEIHALPDFYTWLAAHPGVNGYDIAGSYMLFLLDTYGPAKVRQYYKGVPAKKAFGLDVDALEKKWHARLELAKARLRPGLEALLAEKAGLPAEFTRFERPEDRLTDDILGQKKDFVPLTHLERKGNGIGEWKKGPKGPLGSAPADKGDWSEATLGLTQFASVIVKARAVPKGSCYGVKVTLGPKCQAIVLGTGAFLYNEIGGVAFDPNTKLGSKPVEIVLRRLGGDASIWVDGRLVLEGKVDGGLAPVSIGVVQGSAEFEEVAARVIK